MSAAELHRRLVVTAATPAGAAAIAATACELTEETVPVGSNPNMAARVPPSSSGKSSTPTLGEDEHPSGKEKAGMWMQILRGALFVVYFFSSIIAIFTTQLLGAPLYYVNRDLYYAYMVFTKQSFALVATTMTQFWGPALIRISGDPDVAKQIRQTPDGLVEFAFPDRIVLIANHQIYTDWLYLWWVAYANRPGTHGHLYIILKESLKYIPVLGVGMMFYGFIFMSRKMAVDQPRLAHRLSKLTTPRRTAAAASYLDPMWLLLFPEGTNLSDNGRVKSAQWAAKNGLHDPEHVLLPRSTGTFFCLNELRGTVEYVYDCTMAYEGVPRGDYGEQYFTLSSIYFQGRRPKSVNFYWRRFRLDDMPLHSQHLFDVWLRDRWAEKDALMEQYVSTGRFPPAEFGNDAFGAGPSKKGYIETEVRTRFPWESLHAFAILAAFAYLYNVLHKVWAQLVLVITGKG